MRPDREAAAVREAIDKVRAEVGLATRVREELLILPFGG